MRIIACGDALFSSRNLKSLLPPAVVALFREADAVFANAEFCCPRIATPPTPRRFVTAVRPELLDEFADLNIRLVSFANNHTGDFGAQGVIDTIEEASLRGLLASGIGRSLEEARAPQFLDTPNGRVALISAATTRAAEFAASMPGKGVPARAGLNPLRWQRAYSLSAAEFEQLRLIDQRLGTAASRKEMAEIELMRPDTEDMFHFGSVFDSPLRILRGETTEVVYSIDRKDCEDILRTIRDAAYRADHVLVSLHAHEGEADNWYAPRAASFIEDFAHQAIDAGASAIFGHGPHMLRGIELYKSRPIFYSLGSLFMQFEAGSQVMTPEMYAGQGLCQDAQPSDLHRARAKDASGRKLGFYADQRFSLGCIAICDFGIDGVTVKLMPIDLDLNRKRAIERGLPQLPSQDVFRDVFELLVESSKVYNTRFSCDEAAGRIEIHNQDVRDR